jgi:hypothetical protein
MILLTAKFMDYNGLKYALDTLRDNAASLIEIKYIHGVYLMVYTANYQLFF